MRTRAIAMLCGVSAVWGSDWIFAPLLADVASPYTAAALSTGIAAVVLAILWMISRRAAGGPDVAIPMRTVLLLGFTMLALPAALMIFAGRHGLGGWEILLYAMLPLLVALAEQAWTTPMILAVGAVLVLFDSTVSFAPRVVGWALLGLLAVACQAYGLRLAARTLSGFGWTTLSGVLAVQLGLASAVLVVCGYLFDPAPRLAPMAQWTGNAGIGLAWLALPGTAFAYLALYRLLATGPLAPVQIAAGQWVQTTIAVVESAVFLHARPSWRMVAAMVTLVVCIGMLLRPEQESSPASIVFRDTSR
jgi:drug/metabolite transporter (DMT)-like permease